MLKNTLPDLHHINQTGPNSFQVRITCNGETYAQSFCAADYGSRTKAENAAKKWRDNMLGILKPDSSKYQRYRVTTWKRDKSTSRVGVHRTRGKDKRSQHYPYFIKYVSTWTDSLGRHRSKVFRVGKEHLVTDADERHAFESAAAMRDEWEYCVRNGIEFDPSRYTKWKAEILYPFKPMPPP